MALVGGLCFFGLELLLLFSMTVRIPQACGSPMQLIGWHSFHMHPPHALTAPRGDGKPVMPVVHDVESEDSFGLRSPGIPEEVHDIGFSSRVPVGAGPWRLEPFPHLIIDVFWHKMFGDDAEDVSLVRKCCFIVIVVGDTFRPSALLACYSGQRAPPSAAGRLARTRRKNQDGSFQLSPPFVFTDFGVLLHRSRRLFRGSVDKLTDELKRLSCLKGMSVCLLLSSSEAIGVRR